MPFPWLPDHEPDERTQRHVEKSTPWPCDAWRKRTSRSQ